MKGFLAYIPGDSLLHRLDPRTKLLLSLLICVACFAGDNLCFLCAMIAVDLAIGAIGGIMGPALRLLRGLIKLSIFLFILQVLFVQSGTVLLPLPFGLGVTDKGLLTAAQVALRLIGATLPLSLLISMTKLTDLSNALVDGCHVPYRYAFAVTSAIRFVPTFARRFAGHHGSPDRPRYRVRHQKSLQKNCARASALRPAANFVSQPHRSGCHRRRAPRV